MKNSRPYVWEDVHDANVELGDETARFPVHSR
jgi:hypothetical protein